MITTVDSDPVELGFVSSLARPGGNVTGFTGIAYDLAGKRLELLKDLVPNATRVGVLLSSVTGVPGAAQSHFRGTEAVARKLGMQAQVLVARDPDELEPKLGALRADGSVVLSVVGINWINTHRARVVDLIAKLTQAHSVHQPRQLMQRPSNPCGILHLGSDPRGGSVAFLHGEICGYSAAGTGRLAGFTRRKGCVLRRSVVYIPSAEKPGYALCGLAVAVGVRP